jgi:hypothetical protein
MAPNGYHITYGGLKCSSVVTSVQASGAFQILFCLQAGRGVERHMDCYAHVTRAGFILSAGARVKDSRGRYLTPPLPLAPPSTAELVISHEHDPGILTSMIQSAR